jgi:predicted nucleic acid-binding Zn ribbon protein
MPTYVYEVITEDGDEGQVFEVVQRMSDPPLTRHPTTGQPVRRVITPPQVATRYTSFHEKKTLSNESLASKGFTKYEKSGDGTYVKTAGEGPSSLSADQARKLK